ncbi:MAG: hypothetical protein ACI4UE_04960 [Candidatus Scatovivens sp.]
MIIKNKKEDNRKDNKISNENSNRKLTGKRKKELEKEIDDLISKLSDNDIITLEDMGELTEQEIEYIKRRKRRRKSKKEIFEARIRCDEETINRIIEIEKKYSAQLKEQKDSEKTRDQRIKLKDEERTNGNNSSRQKNSREERIR